MEWQFSADRPIYVQLVEQIERAVVTGVFAPGQKLPGVRELAGQAGVNPNTMQRALAELEGKGLLYAQRTSGRFVTDDGEKIAGLRGELATKLSVDYIVAMGGLGIGAVEAAGYVRTTAENMEKKESEA